MSLDKREAEIREIARNQLSHDTDPPRGRLMIDGKRFDVCESPCDPHVLAGVIEGGQTTRSDARFPRPVGVTPYNSLPEPERTYVEGREHGVPRDRAEYIGPVRLRRPEGAGQLIKMRGCFDKSETPKYGVPLI